VDYASDDPTLHQSGAYSHPRPDKHVRATDPDSLPDQREYDDNRYSKQPARPRGTNPEKKELRSSMLRLLIAQTSSGLTPGITRRKEFVPLSY
jgi:hypothetical protein